MFGLNSISSLLLRFLLPNTEFECAELPVKFVTQSGGLNCAEISDGPWFLALCFCFFLADVLFLLPHFLNGITNLHLLLQECALNK